MKNVIAKRREQYNNSTQMNVSTIRFTQKSINDTFSNGTPIKWTIFMLKTKQIIPIEIPLIRVGFYNGYYKSIDNRRLYCYKQSNIKTIPVIVMKQITKEFKNKDQSSNNGISVTIIHSPKPPSNENVTAYNPLSGKVRTWTIKNIINESKLITITKTKSLRNKGFYCDLCQIHMSSNDKSAHLKGKHHAQNKRKQNKENIAVIFDCNICEIKTYTLKDKTAHLNGSKHKANLAKYDGSNQTSSKKSTCGNKTFYCDICKTSMSLNDKLDHLNGKRHKSKLIISAGNIIESKSVSSKAKPREENKILSQKIKKNQELNSKLNDEKLKCKSLEMKNKKLSLQINKITKTMNGLRKIISRQKLELKEYRTKQQSFDTIDDEKKVVSEMDKVRNWLTKTVKLPQYFEILIKNGFDDLDIITDINNDDMINIGIHKIGHRKKIIKYVMKLGDNANIGIKQENIDNINQFEHIDDDTDKFVDELVHDIVEDFDNAFNIAYQSLDGDL